MLRKKVKVRLRKKLKPDRASTPLRLKKEYYELP
jgi:hypothetical protein